MQEAIAGEWADHRAGRGRDLLAAFAWVDAGVALIAMIMAIDPMLLEWGESIAAAASPRWPARGDPRDGTIAARAARARTAVLFGAAWRCSPSPAPTEGAALTIVCGLMVGAPHPRSRRRSPRRGAIALGLLASGCGTAR